MMLRKLVIFILGLVGLVVPGRASMSFFVGDNNAGTLSTAISNWNTATGLNYLSSDITFTGSLSGSPATYTDAMTSILFEGLSPSGTGGSVVNGAQDSLSKSGTSLVQAAVSNTGGIIEITGFSAVDVFAFEYQPTFASSNGFCIEVNHTSYNEGLNCDSSFGVQSNGDFGFVGLTSSVAITSIWIGPSFGQNQTLQLNNFDLPSESAGVAERSTFFLFGTGLILLGFLGRRRAAALADRLTAETRL